MNTGFFAQTAAALSKRQQSTCQDRAAINATLEMGWLSEESHKKNLSKGASHSTGTNSDYSAINYTTMHELITPIPEFTEYLRLRQIISKED